MHKIIQKTKSFIRNEDGIATAWAIGWLILCFSIAGLSIDITNAWKVKQFLQSTADVAAHAGGLELGGPESQQLLDKVTAAANEYASLNMNPARYGDVLVNNDVSVGYWDNETKTFQDMNVGGSTSIPDAVRVVTRQDGIASSKVGTFFLRFVGFDAFTIAATTTVQNFISICERDGLMAAGSIKMSTQQSFLSTYCVYGIGGINASDQNFFDKGATAGMVNLDDCGPLPENCTDVYNPGIEDALRQGTVTFGKVDRISTNIDLLKNPYSEIVPDYIDRTQDPIVITDIKNFDPEAGLKTGRIHIFDCTTGGATTVNLGGLASLTNKGNDSTTGADSIPLYITKSEMVIVGESCNFAFDSSVSFEDAYIATDATGLQTFSGSANARFGSDDDCGDGGEVTLITAGSVNFAAKLNAYDLEIVAANDVHFASKGNDGESVHIGTSVWAGGDISMTTKHTFISCDVLTGSDYDLKYTVRYVE